MVTQTLAAENSEERIIWFALTWIYPLYFLGAIYVTGSVIGWLLLLVWLKRFLDNHDKPKLQPQIPMAHTLWFFGMLVMLIALVVGHLDYGLGTAKLIKSSIGWAKGWALLALFILSGALSIRPELIYRAAMVVCLHTIILIPLFILAWVFGLPQTAYVSPLQIIGGPGPEFFTVSLYEIDPGSGLPRWRLFTPWAPALGFVANIFFVFALQEKDRFWRRVGYVSCIAIIMMSQSRLALVSIFCIIAIEIQFKYISGHLMAFMCAILFVAFAFFAVPLVEGLNEIIESFKSARADSTRVRSVLARIAIERWSSEAPIWGHGIVERGPHLVEYMPIGSHHTWFGLLFVKGIVGMLGLAIPLLWSMLSLAKNAAKTSLNRAAFCCSCLLFLYTFGENLEILAYLIWPALLLIGLAHSQIHHAASTSLPSKYLVFQSNKHADSFSLTLNNKNTAHRFNP
jgi:hypothetical protein